MVLVLWTSWEALPEESRRRSTMSWKLGRRELVNVGSGDSDLFINSCETFSLPAFFLCSSKLVFFLLFFVTDEKKKVGQRRMCRLQFIQARLFFLHGQITQMYNMYNVLGAIYRSLTSRSYIIMSTVHTLVWIGPGCMQLNLMPYLLHSEAKDLLSENTQNELNEYPYCDHYCLYSSQV